MTKYEYYWASQLWPNTNNIWLPKNDQILSMNTNFVEVPKRKASKTGSESHKVMLNSPSPLMTEANYKYKQLPIHITHPMWLWYMRMNCSFGAQSTFGSTEYSKKNTPPLIFQRIGWSSHQKSDKFSCAHSSKVSMLSKICIVFRKNFQRYSVWENHPNRNTNNIWFEKLPEYE